MQTRLSDGNNRELIELIKELNETDNNPKIKPKKAYSPKKKGEHISIAGGIESRGSEVITNQIESLMGVPKLPGERKFSAASHDEYFTGKSSVIKAKLAKARVDDEETKEKYGSMLSNRK